MTNNRRWYPMTNNRRWYMAHKDEPRHPGDDAPPSADSIKIIDCGDPTCKCAHILLMDDKNDIGLAQAIVNLDMVRDMLWTILRKEVIL